MSQQISQIRSEKILFGTKVKYQPEPTVVGVDKIVGLATNGDPLIGLSYIIEPEQSILNKTYPYSHFVCPEISLKEI